MKTANAICKHILFFADTQFNAKKNKKSLQPNALGHCKLSRTDLRLDRSTGYNTGLAKVAVQCTADTFVVNQSLVLRIDICGENRHLRQARNRYSQW
jgi:hypothetical protein